MAWFVIKCGIIMRAKLDLNLLRIFVAVVEQGSFVGAARALAMPTSNVSRAISQLERQLDQRLIERSTRSMRLTPNGQLLHERAQPLLASLDHTAQTLSERQQQLRGPLRLCVPNEVGPYLLGEPLAAFAVQHPQIEISCVTNLAGMASLLDDVDLAVMISRGMLDDSDYVAQPLASFPCIVVAAPALLAQWPPTAEIEQFTQLPCISTVDALKGMPWQFVRPDGKFVTVPVNARYRVNSGEMALKAALAGVGFAMLSELGCRPFLADGRLVEIPLALPPAPLQLYAVYPGRRYLPAKTRALLTFLIQQVGEATNF